MPRRADPIVAQVPSAIQFNGGGVSYLVQTPTGVLYCVYLDSGSDVAFRKSTDGGLTWSVDTIIFAGTATQMSVWYDRWSDISAGLIHIVYAESANDDVFYRTINTESSDALSTQTTIAALASTASPAAMSVCRARGGNVYVAFYIDVGAEGGFYRLPNANVPNGAWDAARATMGEGDTTAPGDHWVLMPGWASDNQDMMLFYWDRSASEVSRKLYDDSLNTWSETSIATSMTIFTPATAFPNIAGAVDIANSRNLLIAWNGVDTANADLRVWHVTESAITEVTNVVQNGTDDQGLCGITIDTLTGFWYAYYTGLSDGTKTWPTATRLYYKVSQDSGSTWGAETALQSADVPISWFVTIPRVLFRTVDAPPVTWYDNQTIDMIRCNIGYATPQARLSIGL